MTSEATLRELPGGDALLDWFGRVPHFHDAYLLEMRLDGRQHGLLRIHTWEMTPETDSDGYFILDKHAIVTVTLHDMTQITLSNFILPGIIGSLEITKTNEGYEFSWDASYGVEGSIQARQARLELSPGKP